MQLRDMQVNLEDVLCNLPLEVVQGTNRVEFRLQGVMETLMLVEIFKHFQPDSEPSSPANRGPRRESMSPMQSLAPPPPQLDFVFYAGNGVEDDEFVPVLQGAHGDDPEGGRPASIAQCKRCDSWFRRAAASTTFGVKQRLDVSVVEACQRVHVPYRRQQNGGTN
jgi:hypothetical protein